MEADLPPQLPGLDPDRVATWVSMHAPAAAWTGPINAELIAGGRSNLTYRLSTSTGSWIVRRPPLGHILATAHDMSREYRVMSALHGTDVPVPRTLAMCTDVEVIGAPFYLMEYVEGTPYRHAAELEALGPERTRTLSTRLVDTLATLHEVAPEAVGLDDFGRPEGFLGRQLATWKKQLDASYSRELPGAEELHARLSRAVPAGSRPSIVHGDYRLDNVLADADDRLVAIIDWEMATLGDPLTDLALLVMYQRLGDLLEGDGVADAASASGFLREDEILQRYSTGSNHDLSAFGFYLGLAAFKLAAIAEGIHFRHLQGQTVGSGFDKVGDVVEPLVHAGLDALKEHD
jgi:aminoglycoside phosphotransferase (APT) family kinase protein